MQQVLSIKYHDGANINSTVLPLCDLPSSLHQGIEEHCKFFPLWPKQQIKYMLHISMSSTRNIINITSNCYTFVWMSSEFFHLPNSTYSMEWSVKKSTRQLHLYGKYILIMKRFRAAYRGISHEPLVFKMSVYTKKIQVTSAIFHGYTTRTGCKTILYHAIENSVARWEVWVWYSWIALIDGKVRWKTDEYTTAFLHSDWLYFLWHGIKCNISNPTLQKSHQHVDASY